MEESLSPTFIGFRRARRTKAKGLTWKNQDRRREEEEERVNKSSGGEKCAVIENNHKALLFRFLNVDVIKKRLNLPSSNARTRNEKGEIVGPFGQNFGEFHWNAW